MAGGKSSVPTSASGEAARSAPGPDLIRLTSELPPPSVSIEEVILRRGSTRRFSRESIDVAQLATILDVALREPPSDLATASALTDPYLIVNAVDGLASGVYAVDRGNPGLKPLRLGNFRDAAGFLDLGQELAADAAVNVYALADLNAILPRLGNRGYRAAQLAAAIEGGKLYLAAYALGRGATGLTFFDDDVTRFFSPDASGKSVMFLTAIGRPARRRAGNS
jgi:nitroreductase